MTIVSARRFSSSVSWRSSSVLKCALAIDAAVCRGGGSTVSSISESGDFPTIAEALVNCAEDDRRDGEALDGATPPTPWREFIEAFLSSVGVEERASRLMELGLRWRGLRGATFPLGDEVELFRWSVLEGEPTCGEAGRAVEEAALIERRFSECDNAVSLFVDGGNGAVSLTALFEVDCDIVVRSSHEPSAHQFRESKSRSSSLLFV